MTGWNAKGIVIPWLLLFILATEGLVLAKEALTITMSVRQSPASVSEASICGGLSLSVSLAGS